MHPALVNSSYVAHLVSQMPWCVALTCSQAAYVAAAQGTNLKQCCGAGPNYDQPGLCILQGYLLLHPTAFFRLPCVWCRWVQGECASLGDMDAPEVDPRLHRAAEALRERQVLFRYCAEEVATARHNAMFQRYMAFLWSL